VQIDESDMEQTTNTARQKDVVCFFCSHRKEAEMVNYTVTVLWDEEAALWAVVDSNVPGLNAEAATQVEMIALLQIMIPELVELNGMAQQMGGNDCKVPAELIWQQSQMLALGC
jgi:hypothetical protein